MWSAKAYKFFIFVTVFLFVANVVLVGAPGALLFLIGDIPALLLLGDIHGDYGWTIALLYGFVWPILFIFAYSWVREIKIPAKYKDYPDRYRSSCFLTSLLVLTILLSTGFHVWAIKN